jgi:hypothetical protein
MFDSPFTYCPRCGEMVLLDQTQRECAAEHRCGDIECPLGEIFSGIDFEGVPPCKEPEDERRQ